MIKLSEINVAINIKIEKALKNAGYEIPIVSEDLSEPIIRPSVKVILENTSNGKYNSMCRERTLTYRVYFFAKNKKKPKFENIAVQEIIENAFLKELKVKSGFYISVTNVDSNVSDGVLVCSFDLYTIELLPDEDYSEVMEELDFKS